MWNFLSVWVGTTIFIFNQQHKWLHLFVIHAVVCRFMQFLKLCKKNRTYGSKCAFASSVCLTKCFMVLLQGCWKHFWRPTSSLTQDSPCGRFSLLCPFKHDEVHQYPHPYVWRRRYEEATSFYLHKIIIFIIFSIKWISFSILVLWCTSRLTETVNIISNTCFSYYDESDVNTRDSFISCLANTLL